MNTKIQEHIGLLYFVTKMKPFILIVLVLNIKANIFRVQANNSIMCGYFFIGFIYFMLAFKKLNDFTFIYILIYIFNIFSPYHFDKNSCMFLNYFNDA